MPSNEEVRAALAEIKRSILSAVKDIQDATGVLNTLKAAHKAIPAAVQCVESVSERLDIKGADKKALAIQAIMLCIKLPWYVPAPFVRAILSGAIDAAVEALNKKLGKDK